MDTYILLKYNEFNNTYIECCSSFNYELVLEDYFKLLKEKYSDEYYLICHVMEDSYNVSNINR